MQKITEGISYFNPFDNGLSQAASDFKELKGWKKTAAVAAAFFGALFTPFLLFTGGFAAFRKTVEILKPANDCTADRADRSSANAIPRPVEPSTPVVETKTEKLVRLTNSLLENRGAIWDDSGGAISPFLNNIRAFYREEGLSLSDAIQIRSLRQRLCCSGRIEAAVKLYELRILTSRIVQNKEHLYQEAREMAGDHPQKQLFVLTLLLRGIYQANGRSLREVLIDRESMTILSQSNTLKIALRIYQLMIQRERIDDDSPDAEAARMERRQHQAVHRLARDHAPQEGFVTQLGLNTVRDNPQQIKQRLKRIFLDNHPDRNPEGDQALVKAAGAVQNMLRDQVFEEYLAEIDRLRAQ